jgi:hypothetical protein
LKLEDIDNVPIKNKFWKDLIKYFFELKFRDELNLDSVIWYNSHLKLVGKLSSTRNVLIKESYLLDISLMTTTYLKHLKSLKINMIVELTTENILA